MSSEGVLLLSGDTSFEYELIRVDADALDVLDHVLMVMDTNIKVSALTMLIAWLRQDLLNIGTCTGFVCWCLSVQFILHPDDLYVYSSQELRQLR